MAAMDVGLPTHLMTHLGDMAEQRSTSRGSSVSPAGSVRISASPTSRSAGLIVTAEKPMSTAAELASQSRKRAHATFTDPMTCALCEQVAVFEIDANRDELVCTCCGACVLTEDTLRQPFKLPKQMQERAPSSGTSASVLPAQGSPSSGRAAGSSIICHSDEQPVWTIKDS